MFKLFKKRKHAITKKQAQILIGGGGLIIALIVVIIAYRSGRFNPDASTTGSTQSITATARVLYCTEGEDTSVCNPGTSLYSGSVVSNTVTTAIQQVTNLCFNYTLAGRTTASNPAIAIKVVTEDGTILASESVAGDSTGRTSIEIANPDGFAAGETYTAVIKPAGFLGRKITVNTASTDCVTLATEKQFIYGDFDGDNRIKLTDIILAIRAYNGEGTDTTRAVFGTEKPTISNLVTIIRNYNESPQGEE